MHTTHVVVLLVVAACLTGGQQTADLSSSDTDPDSIGFVRSALQFIQSFNQRGGFSGEIKKFTNLSPSLPQMGDRVSIAILKIYSPEELVQVENANACLTAIRIAFRDRSKVVRPSDRDPRVTLFLLDYLQEKRHSDANFQKRIEYVKTCAGDFSCSSQGEHDFFVSH